jgi:hypothetical protein
MADVRDMYVVHRAFRRELGLLPGLVRAVAPGDTARATVLARHARMCLQGLHLHHTGEDELLWPKLLERCTPDAELIHRMEAQHERVHDALEDLGPALDRWSRKPFVGSGFGTTVADPNAPKESEQQILDDQWLGSLLEIGAIGGLALLWLYVRAVRRLTRIAKTAAGSDAWLVTALAAAIISFAAGMLTFDAFAFIQVTFLAFVLLALSSVAVRSLSREGSQRLSAAP